MEGSKFSFPDKFAPRPEEHCPECGQLFRPRLIGDGVEELCDTCYEAQFQPMHLSKWQKMACKPRSVRPQGTKRPRRGSRPASAA